MSKKSRHRWITNWPGPGLRQCKKCGKESTMLSHSGMGDCDRERFIKEMKDEM